MDGKFKRIIHKYFEYFTTKIVLLYKQKTFRHANVSLKYILEKNDESKDLIIVFSSCTRRGIKARYNYMRTLAAVKANKLFILDDFAKDKRGSYYLGKNNDYSEEQATIALIKAISESLSITGKKIFCGSSKGGYSALNFGLMFDNAFIVAGAPQFYLGTYLTDSGNIECLEHIIGNPDNDKILELDGRLKGKILACKYIPQINVFLNYSDKEHTYSEHIADLVCALKEKGYNVDSKVEDFTDHSEISLTFPSFLKTTIGNILRND